MNITIDTEKKTIIINETINIKELNKFLKDNLTDYEDYSIQYTNNWIPTIFPVYPTYPVYPEYPIITYSDKRSTVLTCIN